MNRPRRPDHVSRAGDLIQSLCRALEVVQQETQLGSALGRTREHGEQPGDRPEPYSGGKG